MISNDNNKYSNNDNIIISGIISSSIIDIIIVTFNTNCDMNVNSHIHNTHNDANN